MPAKKGEVLIGKVGVDSGSLLVCDPCYIDSEWEDEQFDMTEKVMFPDGTEEEIVRCSKRWFELINDINNGKIKLEEMPLKPRFNFSYNACAQKTVKHPYYGQLNYKMGHPGVGVTFSSGIGDGYYPVYAKIEEIGGMGKRIVEVRIDMLDHPLLEDVPQEKRPICPIHKTDMDFNQEKGWHCKQCSPCPAVRDEARNKK